MYVSNALKSIVVPFWKYISVTLGAQINVRVQISVQAGNFGKTNKRTGPNKRTG